MENSCGEVLRARREHLFTLPPAPGLPELACIPTVTIYPAVNVLIQCCYYSPCRSKKRLKCIKYTHNSYTSYNTNMPLMGFCNAFALGEPNAGSWEECVNPCHYTNVSLPTLVHLWLITGAAAQEPSLKGGPSPAYRCTIYIPCNPILAVTSNIGHVMLISPGHQSAFYCDLAFPAAMASKTTCIPDLAGIDCRRWSIAWGGRRSCWR